MSQVAPAEPGRPFAALLAGHDARREPPWLTRLRGRARERFEAMGLPGPQDEEWRQTNVRPLALIPFRPAAGSRAPADLSRAPWAAQAARRVVVVNGEVRDDLSTVSGTSLREVLASRPDSVEPQLASVAPHEGHPFAALNLACFTDGVVVRLSGGAPGDEPLHVVHVVSGSGAAVASFPRTLIVAERHARGTVVETYLGADDGVALTAAVTEIVLAEGAQVDHVKVQAEPDTAWHVASIAGTVARDARLTSHNVSWGARLARNDIGAVLAGPGASCHLYGLYHVDGTQHVDNHTWLDHATAHCPSWEMYKGVLAGSARAVFNGRIIVREDAQKTDAKQSNKNLILSNGAVVFTRPQLEIYANDVKCTHGATIGRLDDAALFYLRSRGLAAAEARHLLVHAFVDDVLGKIPSEPVRTSVGAALHARLARDLSE